MLHEHHGRRNMCADWRLWLRQAEHDRHAADVLAEAGRFEWACFACQQAAEKRLKALLLARESSRPAEKERTGPRLRASDLGGTAQSHSVVDLWRAARRFHRPLTGLRPQARELDRHYLLSRYPDTRTGSPAPGDRYTESDYRRCRSALEALFAACEQPRQ